MSRIEISPRRRDTPIALAALLVVVVISGCSSADAPSPNPHQSSTATVSASPAVSTSSLSASPSPQPGDTPVCNDLTELGDDLNTLQFGPSANEPQELQAIGSLLSEVVAQTSQQSSDLGTLNQDYHTTVTNSGDGSDEDQGAILTGISNMDDDFNALESACSGS